MHNKNSQKIEIFEIENAFKFIHSKQEKLDNEVHICLVISVWVGTKLQNDDDQK